MEVTALYTNNTNHSIITILIYKCRLPTLSSVARTNRQDIQQSTRKSEQHAYLPTMNYHENRSNNGNYQEQATKTEKTKIWAQYHVHRRPHRSCRMTNDVTTYINIFNIILFRTSYRRLSKALVPKQNFPYPYPYCHGIVVTYFNTMSPTEKPQY